MFSWENHIGKSGPAFESVIKKLQDDGLPAQSEPYHELAGDIIAVGKAGMLHSCSKTHCN